MEYTVYGTITHKASWTFDAEDEHDAMLTVEEHGMTPDEDFVKEVVSWTAESVEEAES